MSHPPSHKVDVTQNFLATSRLRHELPSGRRGPNVRIGAEQTVELVHCKPQIDDRMATVSAVDVRHLIAEAIAAGVVESALRGSSHRYLWLLGDLLRSIHSHGAGFFSRLQEGILGDPA